MNYIELTVIAPAEAAEILIAELGELPFDTFEETPTGFNGYCTEIDFEAAEAPAYALIGHYRQQFVYNVRIPRAQQILGVERKVHTAEHLASAMFYLGAPVVEIPRAKLAALPSTAKPSRPTAVIHALASQPAVAGEALSLRLLVAGAVIVAGVVAIVSATPRVAR